MSKFKNVDPKHDFVKMENEILNWWNEKGIQKKYFEKNQSADKHFSFIDGPITANGPMGPHHAWGRTYKDLVCRYKNLKGYEQRFQMGFDCQGLWVEVEVEKALGFNSKKDIFDFGMDKFTNECVARVNKFSDIQTEQSKRLGMFMDWENSYYTMSENNNLYIWHFLKECKKKDLLYKNHSATTWCPRCETGLSEHEKADGYAEVVDTSVFVKFKVEGRENEYLLAWTTTPWTLSSNVLLAVNRNFEYVKVKDGESTYYLAKKPALKLGFKDIVDFSVDEILKLKYESLYDIPAQKGIEHKVVNWELVSESDGTGIVHIAPGCGQEDYELGLEVGAPAISPLDETGHFLDGFGSLTGKYAHDVKEEVFEYLKSKDLLFKTEDFKHVYPHCWRCKTKCLFRLENNWFINISKIREDLKKEAEKANWLPEYAGKRMQDWLRNMGDWMISRKRFYGLALPFYECDCGEVTVVGSKGELKELAVDPSLVDNLKSIHRPWIDEVKIKCPKCGKEVTRVADVGDCWLDAGVVPFSTLNYLNDKEYWKKWYPAEYITEMIEQVRLWFYSMLVFGVVLEGSVPYQNVLTFAEMRDENNEKLSKTKKNFIPFEDAAEKVGSDVLRWSFALLPLGKNIKFGWGVMEDSRRQFLLPLWNTYSYFVTYANTNNFVFDENLKSENTLDKWVLSRLGQLLKEVSLDMDGYKISSASLKIKNFVLELSTWYIRRSRNRFKDGDKNALNTLYKILLSLTKILSPFMPFVTEEIYKNLSIELKNPKESVHLEDFPEVSDYDQKVLDDMEMVKEMSSIGLKIRDMNKIKLRQPLSKAYARIKDEELLEILKSELNVKEIGYSEKIVQDDGFVSLENSGYFISLDVTLTPELKKEGYYRDLTRTIQDLRKKNGLQVGQKASLKVFSSNEELNNTLKEFAPSLSTDTTTEIEVVENDGNVITLDSFEVKIKL